MHCNHSCQLQISALKWKLNQLSLLLGVWGCWRSALILAFLSSVHVCHLHWLPALRCHKSRDTCPDSCLLPKGAGKTKGKGLDWATS